MKRWLFAASVLLAVPALAQVPQGTPLSIDSLARQVQGRMNLSPSATTDTTDASNISKGTISLSRLPTIPFAQMSGSPSLSQIVGGLGFTPYDGANPNGFISSSGVGTSAVSAAGGTASQTPSARFGQNLLTTDCGASKGGSNTTAVNNCLTAQKNAGGGVMRVPGGYAGTWTWSLPDPTVLLEVDGPNVNRGQFGMGGAATDSGKVFAGVLGATRPSGNNRAGISDFFWSEGSGFNGANHADFVHSFQEYKENWNCTTARKAASQCSTVALQGENDVLYLALFQGGPDATSNAGLKSAGALGTGAATCVDGIGFCGQFEFQTIIEDASTLAITKQIDIQYGAFDTRPGELTANGISVQAMVGNLNGNAYYAYNTAGASWGNFLQDAYNGVTMFNVDDAGGLTFGSPGNGAAFYLTSTGSSSNYTQSGILTFKSGSGTTLGRIYGSTMGTALGYGGFSSGIIDTATPAWITATSYAAGALVQNGGYIYRMQNVAAATSSVAPTHTSGCVTGADALQWCVIWQQTDAPLVAFSGGAATATGNLYLRSIQNSPIDVPVMAIAGTPAGIVSSPQGGMVLRTNGGNGRTLYLQESSGTSTNWNSVVTNSGSNNIVAAGSTLVAATPLTAHWNVVTSVPSAGNAVSLAGSAMPDEQVIFNRSSNALTVYPPSASATIDSNAAGASVSIAAGGRAGYYCINTTQCFTSR